MSKKRKVKPRRSAPITSWEMLLSYAASASPVKRAMAGRALVYQQEKVAEWKAGRETPGSLVVLKAEVEE